MHVEMLRTLPFLRDARPEVVARLAEEVVERAFQAGDVILEEGAAGGEMYLVVEGLVEVVKGQGSAEMVLSTRGPGDALALYTDGMTDALSTADEFFGSERLCEALRAVGAQQAQAACDAVFAEVDHFQEGAAQHDDMALLVVKAGAVL